MPTRSPSPRSIAEWRSTLADGRFTDELTVPACRGRRVVGAAVGRTFSDGTGWIGQLAVAGDEHGHGLGGALPAEYLVLRRAAGATEAGLMATDRGAVRPYLAGGRGVRPEYRFHTPPLRAGHDAVQQPGTEPRRVGVHRFEDVVAAELAGLLRYATALSGDPHQAHDLVQEVLARAYTRWSTVGATERPSAYLMTMVTNEFVSWRRRWHTRSVLTLGTETLERAAPAGRDHSESIVDRDDLERRLSQLPRRQQAALVLRFFEGLDYAETAAILGCAEGTVRSACSRGLAALRLEAASGAPPQRASAALTPTENP